MVLGIYGSGGAGKEVKDIAEMLNKWSEIVFIDDTVDCDFFKGILPNNYTTGKYNNVLLDIYLYKIEKKFFCFHLIMVMKDFKSVHYQGKERI